MKKTIVLLIIILLGINLNSNSQVLVNKISDIDVLIQKKSQFINQPFSFLLNHISLEIKKARAYPAFATAANQEGVFHLFFVDNNEYDSLIRLNKMAPNIIVVVKEDFVWKPKLTNWNKSDAEKYGKLTVIDIGKF